MSAPKKVPIMIKPITFKEVIKQAIEQARNAPPMTPEQLLEAQKIAKELGLTMISISVPKKEEK